MSIDYTTSVTVAEDVLVRELDGESVILNMSTEQYLGLDEVGTRMLGALSEAESVQAAYETLLGGFDVEPDVLRRDLDELLGKLLEQGVLEGVAVKD